MSLLELLIAMAVMAIAASFAIASIGGSNRERQFDQAAELLVHDLRQARLSALIDGETRQVLAGESGYRISGEDAARRWPGGVEVRWEVERAGRWLPTDRFSITGARTPMLHARIVLERDERRRVVTIDPVSGRVHDD